MIFSNYWRIFNRSFFVYRGTSSAGSKVDRSRVKLISRQLADIKKELELLEINFRQEIVLGYYGESIYRLS